jgi:serine/threonine-protein kinase
MNPFDGPIFLLAHASLVGLVGAIVARELGWERRGGRRHVLDRGRADALSAAHRIGPYALVARIGGGAMGEVYRARHSRSGQLRALKLLSARASEQQRERFEHEVRLGAQIRHPNTVAALDSGRAPDGRPYFTMDLVEGIDLDAVVERQGPLPPQRVIAILRQVAAALADLHERGLVHRDIKPSNILICGDGDEAVKLIDFGLAKHVAEQGRGDDCVVGTPLYISPEAIVAPNEVDGRSDLYGLGAVAYFLLRGAPVFVGDNLIDVCSQHLLRAPEPLAPMCREPIGADLEGLILDCLAKDPAARPRDARELIRRLDRCAQTAAGRAPQPWSRAA